jgi:NTP pyrophosphatase (non-canonical NTP hydrolase)
VTTSSDRLAELQARLRQFTAERDWNQFHDPKNLAMAVASEAGELLAELRWVNGTDADRHVRSKEHRAGIEHEAADVAIALLLFCDRSGFDLLDAIARKIELNRQRYPIDASRGRSERPVP